MELVSTEENSGFDLHALQQVINSEKQATSNHKKLWKTWDELANKSGTRKSVFWVNERKLTVQERALVPDEKTREKQWKTGAVYSGEWEANDRQGYGRQEWPNGSRYEGEWKSGKRHGTGTLCVMSSSENGKKLRRVYAGQWKSDRKHGIGVYFYKNGSRYEGEWRSGLRHGHGTQFEIDGSVYIGEWVEDKRCGWGRLVYQNNDEYVGEWLNDKKEGQGKFFYRDRFRVYDGEWVNDVAKCGVYGAVEDAEDFFYTSSSLPCLELANPDGVIQTQLEEILKDRAAVRALPHIKIDDLFNESELNDLNKLFESADSAGSNCVEVTTLRELLEDVGLQPSDEDIAQALYEMDKTPDSKFNFVEFVKSIYLIKEHELQSQSVDDNHLSYTDRSSTTDLDEK